MLSGTPVQIGANQCVDFKAGKNQLVSFDLCHNSGAIDVKMNGPDLEKKIKMLGLSFSCKLD